jgi:hypothetical protein
LISKETASFQRPRRFHRLVESEAANTPCEKANRGEKADWSREDIARFRATGLHPSRVLRTQRRAISAGGLPRAETVAPCWGPCVLWGRKAEAWWTSQCGRGGQLMSPPPQKAVPERGSANHGRRSHTIAHVLTPVIIARAVRLKGSSP